MIVVMLAAVLAMLIETAVSALVVSQIWAWYILPHFAWAPSLSWRVCCGILILFSRVFGSSSGGHSKDEGEKDAGEMLEDLGKGMANSLLGAGLMLFVAWFLK